MNAMHHGEWLAQAIFTGEVVGAQSARSVGAEVDEVGRSLAHESCVLSKLLVQLLQCRNKQDWTRGGL